MQDSSSHAWRSNVHRKFPPSTVLTNAGVSPMKKRGPGCPQKYPKQNDRAAAGNKQQNFQASGSARLFPDEPVKAGIWYQSSHYKPVISLEWCNKLEKVFMALDMLMNVEEAIKNPPPCAIWLSSISSCSSEKIQFQLLCFLYCSPCTMDDILIRHCAEFVNHKDFCPEYLMNLPEADLVNKLYLLGVQHKQTASLKHLAYQIYFQFKNKVPATLKELLMIRGVGHKIALLTLQYAFNKIQV